MKYVQGLEGHSRTVQQPSYSNARSKKKQTAPDDKKTKNRGYLIMGGVRSFQGNRTTTYARSRCHYAGIYFGLPLALRRLDLGATLGFCLDVLRYHELYSDLHPGLRPSVHPDVCPDVFVNIYGSAWRGRY